MWFVVTKGTKSTIILEHQILIFSPLFCDYASKNAMLCDEGVQHSAKIVNHMDITKVH